MTYRILSVVDIATGKIKPEPSGHQRILTGSFGTDVWDLTNPFQKDMAIGLQFSEKEFQKTIKNESLVSLFALSELKYGETEAAIIFPKHYIERIVNGKTLNEVNVFCCSQQQSRCQGGL